MTWKFRVLSTIDLSISQTYGYLGCFQTYIG